MSSETFTPQHVITPHEVEQMIANALRRLDDATHEHREIQDHAAECEADYRKAKGVKALAIIRSNISAKERDARIEIELDPERRQHLAAQAVLHSQREVLLTLRARLEALRTLAASVRAQT